MELALWSEGAVTYEELKRMPPLELKEVTKSINRHLKMKAKAMPKL